MNCILPRARARPVDMLMLLLILVHQTASASASNVALQRLEEDKDGNVVKESQLRKKPRLVKAEVEEMEDKAFSSSAFQAHAQYFEGDKDFFEFESEQEVQMTKRDLSIFDVAEETANVESIPVFTSDGVYCNDTAEECDLDIDLGRCDWFVNEETEALTCFIPDDQYHADTLDYKDHPSVYPDVSYDYEDAKDEDEEKSSKSGKQAGTGDESGRQLKKKEKKHENEDPESGSELVISTITERERQAALQAIDLATGAVQRANNLWTPRREACIVQIAEVRAAVAGKKRLAVFYIYILLYIYPLTLLLCKSFRPKPKLRN